MRFLGVILMVGLVMLACSGPLGGRTGVPTATATLAPLATAMATALPTDTPEPTPMPTATPVVVAPIVLSGAGTKTERVELVEGLYTVDMRVENNENCDSGSCVPGHFSMQIESAEGAGFDLMANEIAQDWSGSTTIRVVGPRLSPGKQIVSVDAEGVWAIRFTLE